MKLTNSQKRIYDVLNRTNLTDRDKAILISQIQEKLVSGENISTINGEDITKGGNIEIKTPKDIVFKGDYDAENNPAATIQDVKDEISEESYDELQTNDKTIIGSINEVDTNLKSAVKPYVINLTDLLAAQDSKSISTAIGGIDNLNGTVQKNQVIFGTLANGTVAVGIRVLGRQTTLTYFVDSVAGLTVNEIIITNTSGTLTKTANTHAVLTENMVIDNLNSDETTLPLSAAQGKVLDSKISGSAPYIVDFSNISGESTSEEIDAAIGGWDNLVAAINSRVIIYKYNSNYLIICAASVVESKIRFIILFPYNPTGNDIVVSTFNIINTDGVLSLKSVSDKILTDYSKYVYLETTDKTVLGAINENTGNVTRIDRAVGNPVIEEVNLTQIAEAEHCWSMTGVKISNAHYSIVRVTLQKGDLLIASVLTSPGTAQLTVVDEAGANAVELVPSSKGEASLIVTSSYYANKDCKVDISQYGTGTYHGTKAYIIKSPFNTAISDNSYMQYLHKVYEEYGAVYNEETGYWEYGDLKDMTEEDCFLAAFYALEQIQGELYASFILDRYRNTARTYFTIINPKGGYLSMRLYLNSCFAVNSRLEYLKLSKNPTSIYLYIKNMESAFRDCAKLRKIEDILTLFDVESKVTNAFKGCVVLRDVKIKLNSGANVNISFESSPILSYESIKYLVDNAANTSAITVTVHPTTYSYLTGTAQPTDEVGGTTEEWQALVTAAQGKQISFAIPEETQNEVTE